MSIHASREGPAFSGAQRVVLLRRLHHLLERSQYEEYRSELARAEAAGEVSEFYALSYLAIVEMSEGSEFASDYLEMAEAVASAPYELVVAAENWTTYDLLRDSARAVRERCLATLDHLIQNDHLWRDLLVAVCRLGDAEVIEATLRNLTSCGCTEPLPMHPSMEQLPECS
ncbi:MAG TPA: hypothetical protein VHW23_42680 [Kofleriaceae bacterium]|jgi:hypothetical protein|nr:hypothetical protein [Kofleriaceae bacterium]